MTLHGLGRSLVSSQSRFKQLVCLFGTNKRQLDVAALAITRDRSAAEDAVHDAVFAISELKTIPIDLKAYLFRTVRNKTLPSIKNNHRFKAEADVANFIDTSNCSAEQKALFSQVAKQLLTLDANQQQVIIRRSYIRSNRHYD